VLVPVNSVAVAGLIRESGGRLNFKVGASTGRFALMTNMSPPSFRKPGTTPLNPFQSASTV
jgi:hypothetical protein